MNSDLMNELSLTSKGWEHWGGEEYQAEATVGSKEFILYSFVCVRVFLHTDNIIYVYIFNNAQ